ncbi:MAG TPA: TRAP transporter large permease [Bacteroidetes bacterium]|nr:TRAP transporter large permease [Bacteroidota bacterium]
MDPNLVTVVCVAILLALIFLGCPIFVSLGTASIIGIYILGGSIAVSRLPAIIFTHLDNFVLLAVPLFLLMGQVLFFSGIGEDLYTAGNTWLSGVRGGLAMASTIACAIFGAMSGVSLAAAAAVGAFAIPEMRKKGYQPRFAAGTVAAAGALAMLIPPSLLFILYGAMADVSVGKLFIGGIVPGIILAAMMCGYEWIAVKGNPEIAPMIMKQVSWKEKFLSLTRLWPALILIFSVLGTIYIGFCTPTEAGAIGSVGSILVALFIYRSLTWKKMRLIFNYTTRITSAVMIIYSSGVIFSVLLTMLKLPEKLAELTVTLGLPGLLTIIIMNLMLILLGMFFDAATAIVVTTPIVLPTIISLGYDPLWWGIILVLNLEMAVITPPVGMNLYTIKSIAEDISIGEIVRGSWPFLVVEAIALAIFVYFNDLTLWLPSLMG